MKMKDEIVTALAVLLTCAVANGVDLSLDEDDTPSAPVRDLEGFAARASRMQPLKGKIVGKAPATVVLGTQGRAGVRVVFHKCGKSKFIVNYDDKSNEANDIEIVPVKDGSTVIPDAGIKLARELVQYVRPTLGKAYSYGGLSAIAKEYVANWNSVPSAEEHVLDIEVRPAVKGIDLFLDGSLATHFGERRGKKGAFAKSVTLVLGPGAEYREKTYAAAEDPRFEVIDLAANPRAKAFAAAKKTVMDKKAMKKLGVPSAVVQPLDSADVSIVRAGKTGGGLDVDLYTTRTPLDGYGAAIHYRVPGRQYVKAHVFFALDEDEKKERLLKLRFSQYASWGVGSSMMAESLVDLRAGVEDKGLVKVGEVQVDAKRKLPLYYLCVQLDNRKVADLAVRRGALDFELLGGTNGRYPDPKRPSAFNVFGLTLEAPSVEFDFAGTPGNVFTRDEKDKSLTAILTARGDAVKARVGWRARAYGNDKILLKDGRELAFSKRGDRAEVKMDFSALTEEGLYEVDFVCSDGSSKMKYPLRVAVTPDAGRLSATEKSPYATWWFYGVHDSPDKWSVGGPILQKAGIRKTYHGVWPKGEYEKYDVTFSGFVYAPGPDQLSEEKFVPYIQKQIDQKPRADHIMIWHETAPAGGIPHEVLGMEVPPGSEADRKLGDYINEVGRLVRKHFPQLRIQIGNSNCSIGAAFKPLRGGAKPEYYDSIGIETPSQTFRPEMLRCCAFQGMLIAQEAASYYAKRKVPVAACYEYVYRADRLLGQRLQAAWYMRDTVISLMHDMPLVSPAILFDVGNAYYDTLWGYSGLFTRHPWMQPKLAYVAYASLTKALDGVKFVRELDTGSTTVYAPLFVRADGKYAVALWCARGEGEMTFGDLAGEVRTMIGRSHPLKAGDAVVFSEEPTYVVFDRKPETCRIAARTFREGEAAAAGAREIVKTDSAAAFALGPDRRIQDLDQWCLPLMKASEHFALAEVNDAERGKVLELKLDTSAEKVNKYYTEYTTLKLKEPVVIDQAETIGIRVKGDSNWGQVRFEIVDADGEHFGNWCHTHGERVDMCDWPGLLAVDFDGWAYVWCRFKGGLTVDPEKGLENAPWFHIAGTTKKNGKIDFPVKLVAVSFGVNREKLVLKDFVPSAATLRLGGIYAK